MIKTNRGRRALENQSAAAHFCEMEKTIALAFPPSLHLRPFMPQQPQRGMGQQKASKISIS